MLDFSEEIDMCKAWSDAQKDAERNGAILSAVETARQFNISEDVILENIMSRFNLTESEAKEYMLKKSA